MSWRTFTATTTIRKVASYNAKRKSLTLANNGSANVTFSPDPTSVSAQGFVVPSGGVITLVRDEGDEPEADMYVIAAAGSQDVRVAEGIGD